MWDLNLSTKVSITLYTPQFSTECRKQLILSFISKKEKQIYALNFLSFVYINKVKTMHIINFK
jgi:hypothetical protein